MLYTERRILLMSNPRDTLGLYPENVHFQKTATEGILFLCRNSNIHQ